jgi:hypothetical protein
MLQCMQKLVTNVKQVPLLAPKICLGSGMCVTELPNRQAPEPTESPPTKTRAFQIGCEAGGCVGRLRGRKISIRDDGDFEALARAVARIETDL